MRLGPRLTFPSAIVARYTGGPGCGAVRSMLGSDVAVVDGTAREIRERALRAKHMEIRATFRTDPPMILRSYRACHPTAIPTRWAVGLSGVAVGVGMHSVLPVLLAVLFVALLITSVRLQLRKYLRGVRDVQVRINDDGYQVTGQDGTTKTFGWSVMKSVGRRSGFWVLRFSAMRALGLPAEALDAEKTAAFVEFLREKRLLRE